MKTQNQKRENVSQKAHDLLEQTNLLKNNDKDILYDFGLHLSN